MRNTLGCVWVSGAILGIVFGTGFAQVNSGGRATSAQSAPAEQSKVGLQIPADRTIKLPMDAGKIQQVIWVSEELGLVVAKVSDVRKSPTEVNPSHIVLADLKKGTAQPLDEFAPGLKGEELWTEDNAGCIAEGSVLAMKNNKWPKLKVWLIDMAKRTAAAIEITDSPPTMTFAGEHVFLADLLPEKNGLSPIRCYTLAGKAVEFPERYGWPVAAASDGKSFFAYGWEDTLSKPILMNDLQKHNRVLHLYKVGLDGKVLGKSSAEIGFESGPPAHVSRHGEVLMYISPKDYQDYGRRLKGDKETWKAGMPFTIERFDGSSSHKLPIAFVRAVFDDGKVVYGHFVDRTLANVRLASADGAKSKLLFVHDVADTKSLYWPLLQGQTLYYLAKGTNVLDVVDLSKVKP